MEETMKRAVIMLVLVSLLTLTMSGCFGTFSMTRKVYSFNDQIGTQFVNSLVMWAFLIIPVYPIVGFIDVVILNTFEFWTGSNPLAMNASELDIRYAIHDGIEYEIITTKNRYDVRQVDNPDNHFALVFDEVELSWYMHLTDETIKLTEDSSSQTRLFNFDGKALVTIYN
jgi:hypothetical protein